MKFYLVLMLLLLSILACECGDPNSSSDTYKYKEGDVVALKTDPTIHGMIMNRHCCRKLVYEVKFYNDNGTFTRDLFNEFELVEYHKSVETEDSTSTE